MAELGSFNKAADVLNVSQPSLTRSIKLLEETLDGQLFERGSRGISMTSVGEELLPHARIILSDCDRAVAAIDLIRGRRAAVISVGTEASFATHILPKAICAMSREHPETRLNVREGLINEMLDSVREGRLSFALGSRAPYLDCRDLVFEPLHNETASVLLRAAHPLLRNLGAGNEPDLALLASGSWVVSDAALVLEGWSRMFVQSGLSIPQDVLRTSSVLITKGCLLDGDFISLGDHTAFKEEIRSGRLLRLDLGHPVYSRPAGVFRRSDNKPTANERTFLQAMRAATVAGGVI